MWRNSRRGWGWPVIVMHWLSALAIFGLFALGWWMTSLGYYDSWYKLGPWWHKSVGISLFALTVLRLVWRHLQITPQAHGTRNEQRAAFVGHVLLYVLLLVVMASGYLISTADGRGISVFGLFEMPALITGLKDQATLAGDVHWYASCGLVILSLGHAAAAFKHHLLDGQDTLRRMIWPLR
ncbi:cytochrome b [Cobetia sp. QF-1]|uniref:cytochrome b n=1 Tax=Cobetia sp. QF-1 TaxID=1969833 RepID=UPI000B53C5ED|nr:cytochrome b [Cobetia sp. QF-1]